MNKYISRLQLIARRATPVARYAVYTPDLDYLKWVDGATRASIDYDYVDDDVLAKSKARQGKLVVPSGAEYKTLVLPVDKKELRERFAGLRIMIGDIPADQVPARWKFGNAEFRFYFNDTDSSKEYAIGSGSIELWDLHTGYITSYKQDRMLLEPGQARLLLRK